MTVWNGKVDEAWVRQLATLACVTVREEELPCLTRELDALLSALEELRDTEDRGDFTRDAVELTDLRADGVGACLSREELLSSSADREERFFRVPSVMDGVEEAE